MTMSNLPPSIATKIALITIQLVLMLVELVNSYVPSLFNLDILNHFIKEMTTTNAKNTTK